MPIIVGDTFADGPSGNTPITAAKLNNVEAAIVADDVTNPASQAAINVAAGLAAKLNTTAVDSTVAGYVSAGATRTALGSVFGIYAPAPTGVAATDTANLQPLVTQAQSTGGTLFLQAGTYVVTNLVTTASGVQPRIIGKGDKATIIQGTTTGSALTFVGNQTGSFSGGYLSDIGFNGTGVGFEIRGCIAVHWDRLSFAGLSTGILFNDFTTGDFTEFCSGQADFASSCVTAVEYRTVSGSGSFNGTGLTGASTINQPSSATLPSILIGAGCQAYNAPLSVMFWIYTATQPLIKNNGSMANFHGAIQIESFVNTATIVDTASANAVYFVGTYNCWGGIRGGIVFGDLILAQQFTWDQSGLNVYADTGWINYGCSFTNMTLGNGTLVARYRQVGKTVHFMIFFTLGSTSAMGTSPAVSLPVNQARNAGNMTGYLLKNGVNNYAANLYPTTSQVMVGSFGTGGAMTPVSATVPFTWAAGDALTISGTYESV